MKPFSGPALDFGAAAQMQQAIRNLRATIQEQLLTSPVIQDALNACDLQPTTRAAWLAADCAINVLLAHDIGQERSEYEAEAPAA